MRRDRIGFSLAALCVVAAVAAPALLTWANPTYATRVWFWNLDRDDDPWGRPWTTVSYGVIDLYYSNGPDGVWSEGRGDDIAVTGPSLGASRPRWKVYRDLFAAAAVRRWWFLGLAALLVWAVRGPFSHTPRSDRTRVEALRALALASLPMLLILMAAYQVVDRLAFTGTFVKRYVPGGRLLVPGSWALAGAVVAPIYLAALGWRLSRSLAVR